MAEESSRIMLKNIRVAVLAFKTGDYQLMNIIGNRIMSDSLFIESPDFALVGFFVKQVALDYLSMKTSFTEEDFLDASLVGERYLTTLVSSPDNISDKLDRAKLWADYHEFNMQIMKYPSADLDRQIRDIYGEDLEFTNLVRQRLISLLSNRNDILFESQNNFLRGVTAEFQRVGLSYGYEVRDTMVFSALIALDRYYNYFKLQHAIPNGKINKKAISRVIFPYIDAIKRLSSSEIPLYDEVSMILWELIKGWREYFIYYGNLPHDAAERTVELSKESKAKLSSVLGKALQKEIKP